MLMMAAIAIVTMTSCSDDSNSSTDDNNNPADNTLIKREVVTYTNGGGYTAEYSYIGKQLNRVDYGDGDYDKATYELNTLKKYEVFHGGHLYMDFTFDYGANGRVAKITERVIQEQGSGAEPELFSVRMRELTYQSDNQISYQEYLGDQDHLQIGVTGSYTFENGNMVRLVRGDSNQVMVFDAKNSPYKNIIGMDKLTLIDYYRGPINNILSYSYAITAPQTSTTTYSYNGNGYPVSAVTQGYQANTTQYFYE